jgi:hypothetical protein
MSETAAAIAEPVPAFVPQPADTQARRANCLVLPAAAQLLSAATARAAGATAGHRRVGLFIVVCALLGVIVPTEIAAESEMFVSRTILGIPPHYALTAFVVALAVLVDIRYLQRLLSRPAVMVGLLCIGFLWAEGILRYGFRSHLVRSDVYIIRWFFVGFLLMRLATVAGMLRPYLIFAAIVILLTLAGIDAKNTDAGQIDAATKRVSSSNLYPIANCGTIMLGLLLASTWPRSFRYAALGSAAFAWLMLLTSIRSSTRSLFLTQSLCLVLVLVALSRDPRMRGRGRGIQWAATALALLGAGVVVYLIATGSILGGYSQLAGRISNATVTSGFGAKDRVLEAMLMVEDLTPEEWVIGQGLGGMFYSVLGAWTNVPHIAVLGWLQKGGLPLFFLVLATVYIAPGLTFFRRLVLPRTSSPLPPPILIVGPALVSWCGLTLISGGIDIGAFLGLGGLTYLWMQLADDDKLFNAVHRRSGPADHGGRLVRPIAPLAGAA